MTAQAEARSLRTSARLRKCGAAEGQHLETLRALVRLLRGPEADYSPTGNGGNEERMQD